MITPDETGIKQRVIDEITEYARKYNVNRVVLFGSRARGDFTKTSDIDIAFLGGDAARFALSVDEDTYTLLEFDVVDMKVCSNTDLIESIQREGKVIYEEI